MQRNSNFFLVAKGQKNRKVGRIRESAPERNIMIFRGRCTQNHEQKLHFNDLPIFKSQFASYFAKRSRKIVPSPTTNEKRKIIFYSVSRKKVKHLGNEKSSTIATTNAYSTAISNPFGEPRSFDDFALLYQTQFVNHPSMFQLIRCFFSSPLLHSTIS